MEDITHRVVRHICRQVKRPGRPYDSLRLIDRLLRQDRPQGDKTGLITLKISEARIRNLHDVVYNTVLMYLSLVPSHPEPWMEMVKYYRDDIHDTEQATIASEVAVSVAKLDGNFVRQSLGERIRTLLKAGKVEFANECLLQIINFRPNQGSVDIGLENDFLLYPTASELNQNIVAQYRAMLSK